MKSILATLRKGPLLAALTAIAVVALILLGSRPIGLSPRQSSTPTATPSPSLHLLPTHTPTASPTNTPTPTCTPPPSPTPTSTPNPSPTAPPSLTPTATSLPPTTPSLTPTLEVVAESTPAPLAACPDPGPLPSAEGCPPSPLTGRRVIAFYGTCAGPGLGILGRHDISTTLSLLSEQIQPYRELDPAVETIPAFHMVVTVADASPGEDGTYSHRVSTDSMRRWIDVVREIGGVAILDIQVGHSTLEAEMDFVEPFLREQDVYLAVDPEFLMYDDRVPGTDLGRISGPEINQIQARLDQIARERGQRQILVVHQFNNRMMAQKECIQDYPCVDLVWDADGFGAPSCKTGDYHLYSQEPGFEYGGFKLFYNYDSPLMTPEEVLGLVPPPALVIYQ